MEPQEFEGRPAPGAGDSGAVRHAGDDTHRHWRWWLLAALPCALVALFSLRYLLSIGPFPPSIIANAFANPWLAIHAAGAAGALLVGPLQFLHGLRRRHPKAHRWLGRAYVLGCAVGGVSGMLLALGAITGPVSTAGFGLLAIAWLATTLLAWTAAMQRRFDSHRAWMVRSFALTFAAVTLRIYLPILDLLPIAFQDGYRAIAFLCWVPNLVLAEAYLRRRSPQPSRRAQRSAHGPVSGPAR